jgi:hypothetical protein
VALQADDLGEVVGEDQRAGSFQHVLRRVSGLIYYLRARIRTL